jgi:AcrR family transcriptional regulator
LSASARQALIDATIAGLDEHGPNGVRMQDICADLGISKALVNYHFGSRDRLIAEAVATGYEHYVAELLHASSDPERPPAERLTAWIDAQVDWTQRHPGLAMALNFPRFLAGGDGELSASVGERLRVAGSENQARLRELVAEVRATSTGRPRSEADETLETQVLAAILGWTTLGMSVWSAGEHLPTHGEHREQFAAARRYLNRRLVSLISE